MAAVILLAGRYRLIERLGMGGMSVVWRAYDEVLGRPVAVKVLAPRFAADPDSRDRIRGEARAAARLCHPHITAVYDYGESGEPGARPVPFVVMELVDGQALDARLAARPDGALPWRFAAEVCAQVAGALAAVHARGLVHRDVKPANIMLTPSGAKVVDFGVSAIVGESDPAGLVYGTPAYLAPERLDGTPADAASDVYALGLVLYRALTGHPPWDADTTTRMLTAHRYAAPEPLPRIPGLPAAVADLCERCLAKDPARRPRAEEIAGVLAAAADARVPAPAVPPALSPTRTLRRPGRRRLVRAGAIGGGLAAAALALATCALPDAESPAGRRAAAAPPAAPACEIVYATRSDAAGRFRVDLTVTNTGTQPRPDWVLAFDYPAGQQVVGLTGAWHVQEGGRVRLRGTGTLAPGDSATVALSGAYPVENPLPTAFHLDGQPCLGRLVGVASGGSASGGSASGGSASGDSASGGSSASGSGSSGGGSGSGGSGSGGGSGSSGSSNSGSNGEGKSKKDKRGGEGKDDGD
jgi:serine/threonine-protein kinase